MLSGVIDSFTQILINLIFFVVCVPFTYIVASELPDKAGSTFASGFAPQGVGETSHLTVSLSGANSESTLEYGRLN